MRENLPWYVWALIAGGWLLAVVLMGDTHRWTWRGRGGRKGRKRK